VAVLVKEALEAREIANKIPETIALKITIGRNKCFYVITSYYPCEPKEHNQRWEAIKLLINEEMRSNNLENIVIAADWNKDIERDEEILIDFKGLGLKVVPIPVDFTYCSGNRMSKIDFFVASKDYVDTVIAACEPKSLSDHKVITLEIPEIRELPNTIVTRIPSKKTAISVTKDTFEKGGYTSLNEVH